MSEKAKEYVLEVPFETAMLPAEPDAIAPDGSEIRLIPGPKNSAASLAHCRLSAGQVSKAVHHQTVEEVWHFLSGSGELWRSVEDLEQVQSVHPGMSITIPQGTHFQFRSTGEDALTFLLVTTPPWPGEAEAVRVTDHWQPTG